MVDIRPLTEPEYRPAFDLFLGTLHRKPTDEEQWRGFVAGVESGRMLGAYEGAELIGTANSTTSALRVPGGAELPMGGVTDVGVRADRTRRGVLSALMRHQLNAIRERGEPVASLRASETAIYGRFGYGIASRYVELTIDRTKARLANPGTVRMLDEQETQKLLPELYRRIEPLRPGAIARADGWWTGQLAFRKSDERVSAVAHLDASRVEDGFARYTVERTAAGRSLTVLDAWAADPEGYREVWQYLLSIDLVQTVVALRRPLDEPLDLLLSNPRAVRITSSEDETWLRIVDVPTALAARTYGEGSVVLEVTDPLIEENSGTYRIGADGVTRTDSPAELSCGVASLAMLYLGDRSPSQLAFAGQLSGDRTAIERADAVFATGQIPWCGTYF